MKICTSELFWEGNPKITLQIRLESNFKLKNKFFITASILPHSNRGPILQCGTISIIPKIFLLDVNIIKDYVDKNYNSYFHPSEIIFI